MRHLRSAFSLVELSIVLAILGVVTAGGLSIGTTLVEQQANVASNATLDEINKAIKDYYTVNGFLPCPADRTVLLGAAGFGAATNCAAAAPAGVIDTGTVRIGALPIRALGLRDRQIADEFGNRYIYAVTERHTNAADFISTAPVYPGTIIVQDGAGNNIATDVSYFVASTGNDGKGGIRYQTATTPTACGASANLDVENCDDDATFRDARFNNGSVAASFYDDFPRWLPKFRLSAMGTGSANTLWSNVGDNVYSVGNDANTATGNVGIGTVTPIINDTGKTLHLHEPTGNTAAIHITNGDTGSTATDGTVIGHWNTGLNDDFVIGTYENKNIRISTNALERMIIGSDGNVGIGTGTPGTARLRVESSIASDWGARFYNTGASGNGVLSVSPVYAFYGDVTASGGWAVRGDAEDNFHYGGLGVANAYGVYGETVRPGGYIGVYGLANRTGGNPAAGATGGYGVYGWGNTNGSIGVRGHVPADVTGAYGLFATVAGAGNYGALIQNTAAGYYCYIGYLNTHAIWCSGPSRFMGNVGVQGAPGADALTVNGDVLANNYYITSDARLKHDIQPAFAEAALDVIAGIKPVHFVWNKSDKKDIGVIAQDVEKVFPEAIGTDDKGFKRVIYDKLILPVIAAIKELHQMVDELFTRLDKTDARITALEKENAELKARLERLEKK